MKTITALMAVAALGLAACGSSSNDTSSSSASSSGSTTAASSSGGGYGKPAQSNTTASNKSTASSKSVQIQMNDNFFSPKAITGKPGSTVKVELKNVGQAQHNFKIDGQSAADADVGPGKDGTATVKIPASGSVQFYCEYHKGLGMVGTVKAS